jgi:ketosteroid isomerase-like protein
MPNVDGGGQANVALVQRMYECFNRDDIDTIRNEIFAPDLVWNLPGHHPVAGIKHGAEEVLAFFAALRHANIEVLLDPQVDPSTGVHSWGENTVVEVHRGRGTTTGPMPAAPSSSCRWTRTTARTTTSATGASPMCRST